VWGIEDWTGLVGWSFEEGCGGVWGGVEGNRESGRYWMKWSERRIE
jgi:hypothetical protein